MFPPGWIRHFILTSMALVAVACSPTVASRGHVTDPEALAALKPGLSTDVDVQNALGSPSTRGTFRDDVWYYMSERTEAYAFFNPKVIERQIVAVVFDGQGVVDDIVTYNEVDGRKVEIVSRVTPTAGNELTLLQQLFGNIGRFESPK